MSYQRVVRNFPSFEEGIKSLMKLLGTNNFISETVGGNFLTREEVISALALAIANAPETWAYLRLSRRWLECNTSSQVFGWNFSPWEGDYSFYIFHPSGYFPEGSALLALAREEGWQLQEVED